MKIKVGIVGYGNLGKAVEEEVLKNINFKLVAIFSRRNVISKYNSIVDSYENIINYKNKIDCLVLCGSSQKDVFGQTIEYSKDFCTLSSFDTHAKIPSLIENLKLICKQNNTVAVSACGWDPGLFSIIRTYLYAFSGEKPITFWGKGISMGHSDALRKLDGVVDAVQFTVPSLQAINLAKQNKLSSDVPLHERECFVVCKKENEKEIENNIKNIPNYFKGQPTKVSFVSQTKLLRLKSKMSHRGKIILPFKLDKNLDAYAEFILKMDSNPKFTAKILTRFIVATANLKNNKKYGAYLPIDIAPRDLFFEKERKTLIKEFC